MRRLLLMVLVLSLLLPSVSWGAIAYVSGISGGSTNTNGFTTGTFNSTGATLIVCGLTSYEANSEPVITDSKGNTWVTSLTVHANTSTERNHLIYTIPTSVGSGHTITVTGNASYPAVACAAFSGTLAASPVDVQNGAVTTTQMTLATGSVATIAGAVALTAVSMNDNANPATIDNSFTVIQNVLSVTAQRYAATLAYKLDPGTVNPTWTWGVLVGGTTGIATFKAAASGGTAPIQLQGNANFSGGASLK